MEPVTEYSLIAEVAGGSFSFKNKIKESSIKTLWEQLARFIVDSLKHQRGVLLPNLGTLSVGPVIGEAHKKVRPSFALLETRYAGVSQERPKYSIGGRCPVVQPNYGSIATAAAVHRGAGQRILLELLQRLGVHLLSGRSIQVTLPGVGRLFTNRAGRIQFEFDTLLREYFELERERVIPEMEQGGAALVPGLADSPPAAQVVKGLQQVHLHDPPAIKSSRPVSTATTGAPGSPTARVKRNLHAPYKGELLDLWRLCKSNDRISSGCVPRLQLEQWLHRECSRVLRQVAAATVLQLLTSNTYGKSGKHIVYKPFLDQLEMAVTQEENSPRRLSSPTRVVEVRIDGQSSALRRQQHQQHQDLDGSQREGMKVALSPVQRGQDAQQSQSLASWQAPADGGQHPDPQWLYPLQGQPHTQEPTPPQGYYPSPQHYPQYQTPQHLISQGTAQYAQPQPSQQQQQGTVPLKSGQHQQQRGQHTEQPENGKRVRASASFQKPPYTPGFAVQPSQEQDSGQQSGPAGSKPYHYYQNQLSPRSRRDFDNFNRLHFQKLQQVRGPDYKHRAVTPKVGEDELNLQEYQAMRLAPNGGVPAEVLSLEEELPYSHDPHQLVVSTQWRRGSPGPRAQILTLGHDQPTPTATPCSYAVPGLPTHQYKPQQQPGTTPQPQYSAQNATQLERTYYGQQPTPAAEDDSAPISQYDIINESDPRKRQLKRNELANALNRNWSEQIREKEAVLENLAEAQSRWPYVPTHQPNDKRPADAVSRPVSAWAP